MVAGSRLPSVGPHLCLSIFARSKRGMTVRKSTYTDMILLLSDFERDIAHKKNLY